MIWQSDQNQLTAILNQKPKEECIDNKKGENGLLNTNEVLIVNVLRDFHKKIIVQDKNDMENIRQQPFVQGVPNLVENNANVVWRITFQSPLLLKYCE